MKTSKEIETILKKNKASLKKLFGVSEIGVFGSYARDEACEESDVDILVDFDGPVGWEFLDLKDHLEKLLGVEVDLVTKRALKPGMKQRILDEVSYA